MLQKIKLLFLPLPFFPEQLSLGPLLGQSKVGIDAGEEDGGTMVVTAKCHRRER